MLSWQIKVHGFCIQINHFFNQKPYEDVRGCSMQFNLSDSVVLMKRINVQNHHWLRGHFMISKINEILLELRTRESKVMKEKKAVITLYHCTKVVLWSLIACHAP